MKVLALIPARAGSKGIIQKNMALCAGKPLIQYTLEAAQGSKHISEICVSTDGPMIAELCGTLGVPVTHLRPSSLAQDHSTAVEVMKFELGRLAQENKFFDLLVYLQPTSPLRTRQHIDQAIELCLEREASSVVSVVKVPHQYSPESVMVENERGFLEDYLSGEKVYLRQQKKTYFARNGAAIYVLRPEVVLQGRNIYGEKCCPYLMNKLDSLDIDDAEDLHLASLQLAAEQSVSWQ